MAFTLINTLLPSGTTGAFAYGGGRFIILKQTSVSVSADDGATWTQFPISIPSEVTGVAYGNGVFVATTRSINSYISTDGIVWSPVTMPRSVVWQSVVFGNGQFVAAGNTNSTFTNPGSATSSDGVTWTAGPFVTTGSFSASQINFNGTLFFTYPTTVFPATLPSVYVSLDGANWTRVEFPVALPKILDNNQTGCGVANGQATYAGSTGVLVANNAFTSWVYHAYAEGYTLTSTTPVLYLGGKYINVIRESFGSNAKLRTSTNFTDGTVEELPGAYAPIMGIGLPRDAVGNNTMLFNVTGPLSTNRVVGYKAENTEPEAPLEPTEFWMPAAGVREI